MTNLKKLLLTSLLSFIIATVHAVSMEGFDTSLLIPYINKAQQALIQVTDEVEDKIIQQGGLHWQGPTYQEILYPLQKEALKAILKELKYTALISKNSDQVTYRTACQLYKAFKYIVYKNWKKTKIIPASINYTTVGRSLRPIWTLE